MKKALMILITAAGTIVFGACKNQALTMKQNHRTQMAHQGKNKKIQKNAGECQDAFAVRAKAMSFFTLK